MAATFHRTVVQVEILSEGAYQVDDIQQIAYDITEGDCSGQVTIISSEQLTGKQMADALVAQGSDPGFMMIDADGNPID